VIIGELIGDLAIWQAVIVVLHHGIGGNPEGYDSGNVQRFLGDFGRERRRNEL